MPHAVTSFLIIKTRISMSTIYKITRLIVLTLLVIEGAGLLSGSHKGLWHLAILFFMPVLWTLWLCCVSLDIDVKVSRLIFLWVLIDIAVLGVVLLSTIEHKTNGRGGEDTMFLIVFSPLILPLILVCVFFPIVGTGVSAISRGASYLLLPIGIGGILPDWLGFSIFSAILSWLFASLCRYWHKRRLTIRS